MTTTRSTLLAACLLALTACGGGGGADTSTDPSPASLTAPQVTEVTIIGTVTPAATVVADDASDTTRTDQDGSDQHFALTVPIAAASSIDITATAEAGASTAMSGGVVQP